MIGHELGHVLSGHAVYRTMLYHLTRLATRLAWFAIGYIGLRVIIAGLEEWYRKSELSCDRAGVLASQDPGAARRALMKIAGGSRISELSPDEFLRQAHEYDAVPDVREGLLKMIQMQGTTHPFAVVRFAELDHWVAEGDYETILAGNYPRREDDSDAKIGDEFVAAAKAYQESWSRSNDPFIGLVKGVAETTGGGRRAALREHLRPARRRTAATATADWLAWPTSHRAATAAGGPEQHEVVAVHDLALVLRAPLGGQLVRGAAHHGRDLGRVVVDQAAGDHPAVRRHTGPPGHPRRTRPPRR